MADNQNKLEDIIGGALELLNDPDYGYDIHPDDLLEVKSVLVTRITANYTPNTEVAERERVARERMNKFYEEELKMHRGFMESVLTTKNLKTNATMALCNKCGSELTKAKEQ